jgi:hypothetical protein
MDKALQSIASLTLASLALSGSCWADAVVVVAEDGGFDRTTVSTVRSMTATELRKHGVRVLEATQFDGVAPISSETRQGIADLGPDRLFVVRLGRLDEKVPIALEELDPADLTPVFVANMTAVSIDEADKVIGRLVLSVLDRKPVESGARIATVTEIESEPFRKKAGEGLWVVGLGLEPLGFSWGWIYEARSWRLGILLQGGEDDVSFFGIDGAWIPHDGNSSPYLGAGFGIVMDGSEEGAVLGAKLEAGVEFLRLHGIRLMFGVNVVIGREGDAFNPGVHLRLCF